jgi:hypothetical protein
MLLGGRPLRGAPARTWGNPESGVSQCRTPWVSITPNASRLRTHGARTGPSPAARQPRQMPSGPARCAAITAKACSSTVSGITQAAFRKWATCRWPAPGRGSPGTPTPPVWCSERTRSVPVDVRTSRSPALSVARRRRWRSMPSRVPSIVVRPVVGNRVVVGSPTVRMTMEDFQRERHDRGGMSICTPGMAPLARGIDHPSTYT